MKTVNDRIRSGSRLLRWLPRALGLGLLVVSATWSGPVSAQGGAAAATRRRRRRSQRRWRGCFSR